MNLVQKRLKIAVLISGRGSNMQALAQHADHYDICAVMANKPAAGIEIAKQAGLKTAIVNRKDFDSKTAHEKALAYEIENSGAEWICLAGYMAVLSAHFIARFAGRIINIHPSLLPEYKGLNTHQRVLNDGCPHHGVSVHLVTAELDDGALIAQMRLAVDETDTPDSLAARVLVLEHLIYPMVMNALAKGILELEEGFVYWHDSPPVLIPAECQLILGSAGSN